MRLPSRILVGCLALLGLSLTAQRADAGFTQYSFSKHVDGTLNPAFATIGIYDGADAVTQGGTAGNLVVNLTVNTATYTGDLFALYANLRTDLIGTMSASIIDPVNVTIAPLTQSNNNVNQVGSNNATSINPIDAVFDLGIQFGVQGASGGSITEVTFQLDSSADTMLQLSDIDLVSGIQDNPFGFLRFGLRVQSTGSVNGGSLKMYIGSDEPPGAGVEPTPAPAGIILLASALPVLGLRRVLRRKTA